MVDPDPTNPDGPGAPAPGLSPQVLAALSGRVAPSPWRAQLDALVADWRSRLASGRDDSADAVSPEPRVVVRAFLVGAVVVVVAVGLALASRPGAPVELPMVVPVDAPAGVAGPSGAGSSTSTSVVDLVVVHAAGAVASPGVYEVAAGARVDDVVRAAGGARPDADLDRVNLAASVADGARVFVPVRGEDVPAEVAGVVTDDPAASGGATGTPGAGGGPAPSAQSVSLSAASLAELEDLPGIGPVTAASIDAYRVEHGGFGSVDELLEVRGIGPARLEQLRPLVSP